MLRMKTYVMYRHTGTSVMDTVLINVRNTDMVHVCAFYVTITLQCTYAHVYMYILIHTCMYDTHKHTPGIHVHMCIS